MARETAADELGGWTLAELVREWVAHPGARRHIREAIHKLGRERDAARAEVAEAQAVRDRALMKHAEQHAEIERLRAKVIEVREAGVRIEQERVRLSARLAELERRDTAAAAVEQAFRNPDSLDWRDDTLVAVEELVRVRQEGEQ